MSGPRRFFKAATVTEDADGFGVALDERGLRTPGGQRFLTPTRGLAQACAAEWARQERDIKPQTMPLTRLVNVAIDQTPQQRAALIGHVGSYAETDLIMHRAEAPASLVARQARAWDPLIKWAATALAARFPTVVGILPAPMEDATRNAVEAAADALDDFQLTGLAHAAGLSGSAVIAFAFLRGRLDGLSAFETACLDDIFSLETWGEDEPARARLEGTYGEYLALQHYFAALAADRF